MVLWRSAAAPPHPPTLHATPATFNKGDSELRLPQERVKYAMLGGSKVVVGTSIASYDRCTHHGAVAIRRRAPAPSELSCHSITRRATFKGDPELRLSQERVKYTMLGGSEVVVGTSIAPYDLMHASRCCGDPPPRPRTRRTTTPLYDPPHDLPK